VDSPAALSIAVRLGNESALLSTVDRRLGLS
jgi:hypothetical protein